MYMHMRFNHRGGHLSYRNSKRYDNTAFQEFPTIRDLF